MGDITRGAFVFTGAAAATGIGIGVLAQEYGPKEPASTEQPTVAAARIDGQIPLAADADAWKDRDPVTLPVLPQQLASPTLAEATLDEITVAALCSDREIGVLVRFTCPGPQDLPGLATFGDAVAMQMPLRGEAEPPISMGGIGKPVHLVRWTSVWQRDVDRGRTEVETIYPNVVRDVSPEAVLPPETAKLYSPGRAVGNPLSLDRRWPVEEVFAEGFGSITPMPRQRARGQGRHYGGRWNVVITAPLDRAPAGDSLAGRAAVPLAFALWIGADGNRGSRKHYTGWVRCTLP